MVTLTSTGILMHACRTLLAVAAAILLQSAPGAAAAQSSPDIERKKKHIVSRVDQLIYQPQDQCRAASAQSVEKLKKATDDFRAAFPEMMDLVDRSPHLASARERSRKDLAPLKSEKMEDECTGYADYIRLFIDTPDAKEAYAPDIELLKK